MSAISVQEAKTYLDQFHDYDDAKLQMLIDAAEDEAKRYLGLDRLPGEAAECPECESEGDNAPISEGTRAVSPLVRMGVLCLVQALYDGTDPADVDLFRKIAFDHLRPYRCSFGV